MADHLEENTADEEYEPVKTYFFDEKLSFVGEDISEAYLALRVFFDWAENHQGRGNLVDLVSEYDWHYLVATKLLFN